ncbi:hypothetical protein GLOIN_2v1770466 [Rhizophagus irregularis DAOM 181602=DAOM 197198]|nr:hypothetical protein GLOIN_2v1770466 [Rhizophagus irregularis DAOM 181602=DAOM 197198]
MVETKQLFWCYSKLHDYERKQIVLKLIKIKGHSGGIELNERADELLTSQLAEPVNLPLNSISKEYTRRTMDKLRTSKAKVVTFLDHSKGKRSMTSNHQTQPQYKKRRQRKRHHMDTNDPASADHTIIVLDKPIN